MGQLRLAGGRYGTACRPHSHHVGYFRSHCGTGGGGTGAAGGGTSPCDFSPLKTLPPDSPVYQLAAHGIAAICVHTPLDMAPLGLNTFAHTLLEKPLALRAHRKCWSRRGRTAEASGGSTPVPAHGHRKRWHRRCKRHSGKCGIPPQSVPFGKLPTVPARLRPCWNWLRQRAVTL